MEPGIFRGEEGPPEEQAGTQRTRRSVVAIPCGLLTLGESLDLWSFLHTSSYVVMNAYCFWPGSVRGSNVEGEKGRELEREKGGGRFVPWPVLEEERCGGKVF